LSRFVVFNIIYSFCGKELRTGRRQVYRAGGGVQVEWLSIYHCYAHPLFHPSKKGRICANLMSRSVGSWGDGTPGPFFFRPPPPMIKDRPLASLLDAKISLMTVFYAVFLQCCKCRIQYSAI